MGYIQALVVCTAAATQSELEEHREEEAEDEDRPSNSRAIH